MKTIAVVALKGGVGKSSVIAGLGIALVKKGYKVGFMDLDITGSNLYAALGLDSSPRWKLDTKDEKVIAPEANGYWLLSIASYAGEENAVLWEESHQAELTTAKEKLSSIDLSPGGNSDNIKAIKEAKRAIDDVLASSKWRFVEELMSPDVVTWPEPLDYRLVDLPPSTSNEMFSFFEQVKDLFGVFIVAQPTKLSNTGLERTINLLRVQQIPIIGLVANQDYYLTAGGGLEYQFTSPRVDPEEVAKKAGIPFLLSIPQSGEKNKLTLYFHQLAEKIIAAKPVVLKDITMGKKLKRVIMRGIARRI